jgi:hypothetical protein
MSGFYGPEPGSGLVVCWTLGAVHRMRLAGRRVGASA